MPKVFVRARHKFSSGLSGWNVFAINRHEDETPAAAVEEWRIEFQREYEDGEHYRGCDIVILRRPPDAWIKKQITRSLRMCNYYRDEAAAYCMLLEESESRRRPR